MYYAACDWLFDCGWWLSLWWAPQLRLRCEKYWSLLPIGDSFNARTGVILYFCVYKYKADKSHRHVLIPVFIDDNRYMYSVWHIIKCHSNQLDFIDILNKQQLFAFLPTFFTHSVDIIISIGFYRWILFLCFYLNIAHYLCNKNHWNDHTFQKIFSF